MILLKNAQHFAFSKHAEHFKHSKNCLKSGKKSRKIISCFFSIKFYKSSAKWKAILESSTNNTLLGSTISCMRHTKKTFICKLKIKLKLNWWDWCKQRWGIQFLRLSLSNFASMASNRNVCLCAYLSTYQQSFSNDDYFCIKNVLNKFYRKPTKMLKKLFENILDGC